MSDFDNFYVFAFITSTSIKKLPMKTFETEERTKIHANGNKLLSHIQYIDYPMSEIGLSNLSIFMSAAASIEFAFCNVTGSNCLSECNARTSETSSTG